MEYDVSTNQVVAWLNNENANWKRFNGEDIDEKGNTVKIDIDSNQEQSLVINNDFLNLGLVKVIWNRRTHGFTKIKNEVFGNKVKNEIGVGEITKLHALLKREILGIHNFIQKKIDGFWLDHPIDEKLNKMCVLELAKEIGLNIPHTLITNSKKELKAFLNRKIRVITKPVSEVDGFKIEDDLFMMYTASINEGFINEMNQEIFFPCLFQELIEKLYEIRTFYLEGQCFSMAIFSQLDQQTKIDFRAYNHKKWNRMIPFKLPVAMEEKIDKLMKQLGLKHGSIDLIKSVNGQYYFLEVNPVGQFGMVSHPCNYYLHEKIAQTLKKYDDAQ